ncbi:MAG: hypothetical protein LBU61_01170, partial [Coriobacteriales bacterium]|nr:hypothetical protein [Coriobacteriales bacterium]
MKRYKCLLCGFEFDESEADYDDDGLMICPLCKATNENIIEIESGEKEDPLPTSQPTVRTQAPTSTANPLPASQPTTQSTPSHSSGADTIKHMSDIHQMARTGETIIAAMG